MYVRAITRRGRYRKWLVAGLIAFVVLVQVFPVLWRPLAAIIEMWTDIKHPVVKVDDVLLMAISTKQPRVRQRQREPVVYKDLPPMTSSARHVSPVDARQSSRRVRNPPSVGSIRGSQAPARDLTSIHHKWNPVSPPNGYSSNCSTQAPLHKRLHCLTDDTAAYFSKTFNWICFIDGTARVTSADGCVCRKAWFGSMCSIPKAVHVSNYPDEYGLGAMTIPRRIIYAFPFANEFDLLETRLHELSGSVDVYVILESNYTASGQPKELRLLQRMRDGFLCELQSKIVYVLLDYFPLDGHADGWAVDALLRNYIGYDGFSRIRNIRDDDLIISTDADEIPTRSALVFLKVHYGYPEPIGFNLRHNVFGFFFRSPDTGNSHVFGACSVAMLKWIFDGYLYRLRRATKHMTDNPRLVNEYKYKAGGRIHTWSFGSAALPSGWHCSWCFRPEGIRFKMLAAHVSDMPRWGAFPSKLALGYIRNTIELGLWFDDETRLVATNTNDTELYAPEYTRNHAEKFRHILRVPFRSQKDSI